MRLSEKDEALAKYLASKHDPRPKADAIQMAPVADCLLVPSTRGKRFTPAPTDKRGISRQKKIALSPAA
jgi:hypothetical protein